MHDRQRLLRFGPTVRRFCSGACALKRPEAVAQIEGCAEVRTSRIHLRMFQLESLILAQNERWRQA